MRYTFHRLANEGEGAELATSAAYLIHHSESHHHPEGRCRRLETFEEKSDGNLMDRRGRGLPHHCLKFYSLCQNHEASEWQSLSCIHILLIFTLVFFGREKRMGSFTIKKKKAIHSFNNSYWTPICASHCVVSGISAEQYRKKYLLYGNIPPSWGDR